uniref:hypothetical protein n=1 Tax=Priestia megaterium TaxID=1404 RepID=UPI001C99A4D2
MVGIGRDGKEKLKNFEWSGNIKQVKEIIKESVVLGEGGFLEVDDVKKVISSIRVRSENEEIDL